MTVVLFMQMSAMTHNLAKSLALLFSKGFGLPKQDEVDDSNEDMTKNASGTGMGEGAGTKDVSDQIEDEDQLLGDSKQVKTAILNPLIHFRVLEMQKKKKHKHGALTSIVEPFWNIYRWLCICCI